MKYQAILFDLDETLIHEEASVQRALLCTCEPTCERYGLDPNALARSVREYARMLWRSLPTHEDCMAMGISSWEGLHARFLGDGPLYETLRTLIPGYRKEVWNRALVEHGVRDLALSEELMDSFMVERRRHHTPFPEAEVVLRDLPAGYRLAVVTNGPSELQREKLTLSGLAPYFEAVVISGELGIGKPDPRIFQRALNELQAAADKAVMVGDSLERDIAGAQQTGISTIWVDRSIHPEKASIVPDAKITDLRELASALEQLSTSVIDR
jgi:putative hydrolase of the HAD superfamily